MREPAWSDPGVRRLVGVAPAEIGPPDGGVDRRVAALGSRPDKAELLDLLAAALDLPHWFGRNWDALADSLADLARPTTLVLVGVDRLDERTATTLVEVLGVAALRSAGGRAPLSALLLDGPPEPAAPDDAPGAGAAQDAAAAGSGGSSDGEATSCWLDG